MALNPAPIQDNTLDDNNRFVRTWVRWFESLVRDSEEGYTGSFTNGDGDTVTVVNGKITDVS